jgi:NAD(P)H-flavin reductase
MVTLTLDADDPRAAPDAPFRPGQFVMVWTPAVGEVPISLSGIGDDGSIELTVRVAGATTIALHDVPVGALLGIRGPFGTSWGVDDAAGLDVLVMAGGIGTAPLRPAIRALLAGQPAPHRLIVAIGAREPSGILYPDELRAWRAAGAEVHVTVDAADRTWTGAVGTVTTLLPRIEIDPAHTLALVCGPEVMMRFSAVALLDRGVPASAIRVSLERNMHCGIAQCGRCQAGPLIVCRDGPIVTWDRATAIVEVRER